MSKLNAAFFGADKTETMKDHIEKGLPIIELYTKRKYHHKISRLAGSKPEDAEKALYAAYILHDVGKCCCHFQRQRKTFRGHEFYSARFLQLAGFNVGGCELLTDAAILAVALHHHTMIGRAESLADCELCADCLKEVLDILQAKTGLELSPTTRITSPGTAVYNTFRKYRLHPQARNKAIRLAYLILIPLTVADNYAARSRGKTESIIGKEAAKLVNIYKKQLHSHFQQTKSPQNRKIRKATEEAKTSPETAKN